MRFLVEPSNLECVLEYIVDHEKEDYETWCEENGMLPGPIARPHLDHIYARALVELWSCGYETEFDISVEVQDAHRSGRL